MKERFLKILITVIEIWTFQGIYCFEHIIQSCTIVSYWFAQKAAVHLASEQHWSRPTDFVILNFILFFTRPHILNVSYNNFSIIYSSLKFYFIFLDMNKYPKNDLEQNAWKKLLKTWNNDNG